MDGIRLLGVDRRALVDGLADDVEDSPEGFVADRNGDGRAGIAHRHPARQPLGRRHGHRSHLALAEVLGDFEHEPLRVREDVLVLDPLHCERVVDVGELSRLELDVDDRPDDLDDLSHTHAFAPLSASAPPTMSSSSLVIFSWRALLYWIVRTSIISLAFVVAASMAVMRAPCSPAADSMRAR